MRYNIYGAGLFGLTIARLLTDSGHDVKVFEKLSHAGGALYTERTPDDIEIHKHGAHIFHTDYEEVYQFINRFSDWIEYKHKVKAKVDYLGYIRYVSLPLSIKTIEDLYGMKLTEDDVKWLTSGTTRMRYPYKPVDELISKIGWDLFEKVIKPYSENQWGTKIDNVSLDAINRIGFKMNWDTGYFRDKYQLLPADGYDHFIGKLMEGLDIEYNISEFIYDPEAITIFTGPVEDLQNEIELPYRSLWWDFRIGKVNDSQSCPVINTPSYPHTRYIVHNRFINMEKSDVDYVSYEYPVNWYKDSKMMRYYPVNNSETERAYNRAKEVIEYKYPKLILAGRLGSYKYYDMDDTIYNAIELWKKL